jgi:hypothetical protein
MNPNKPSVALSCPFCGQEPTIDKGYMPTIIGITCNNEECHVRPSVYENVKCVESDSTFQPIPEKCSG